MYKNIIPLLPENSKIICTHKEYIKPEKFDKKFNLKRLSIKNFFENRDYLNGTNFILNSIPPVEDGDIILNNLTPEILKIKNTIKWYGYFSSTSVYGNHLGKWVDETSKTQPRNLRENLDRNQSSALKLFKLYKVPIHIFRLPGIYGPGRSIFERLQLEKKIQIIKVIIFHVYM